jgi:hypothetical protein
MLVVECLVLGACGESNSCKGALVGLSGCLLCIFMLTDYLAVGHIKCLCHEHRLYSPKFVKSVMKFVT